MTENSITVWLEEEYGYRYWRWETGMSADELVSWWKSLPSVNPYFFNPSTLPGKLTQLHDDEWHSAVVDGPESIRGHIHQDDDSCLLVPIQGRPGRVLIRHAGYVDTETVI